MVWFVRSFCSVLFRSVPFGSVLFRLFACSSLRAFACFPVSLWVAVCVRVYIFTGFVHQVLHKVSIADDASREYSAITCGAERVLLFVKLQQSAHATGCLGMSSLSSIDTNLF